MTLTVRLPSDSMLFYLKIVGGILIENLTRRYKLYTSICI